MTEQHMNNLSLEPSTEMVFGDTLGKLILISRVDGESSTWCSGEIPILHFHFVVSNPRAALNYYPLLNFFLKTSKQPNTVNRHFVFR